MDTNKNIPHHLCTNNALILAFLIAAPGFCATSRAALIANYYPPGTTGLAYSDPKVECGAFQRTANLDVVSTPDYFASANWSTSTTTYDPDRYVSFTLQAKEGYSLSLANIKFYGSCNPPTPALMYNAAVFVGGQSMANSSYQTGGDERTLDCTSIASTSQQVEVRFYGWKASDASYVLAFKQVSINGEVTAVPEPVNIALAGFGLVTACVGIGRRVSRRCGRPTETPKH